MKGKRSRATDRVNRFDTELLGKATFIPQLNETSTFASLVSLVHSINLIQKIFVVKKCMEKLRKDIIVITNQTICILYREAYFTYKRYDITGYIFDLCACRRDGIVPSASSHRRSRLRRNRLTFTGQNAYLHQLLQNLKPKFKRNDPLIIHLLNKLHKI
ncbi:hypothetical protein DICVIV_10581 [Dictyocaulus viviparus]|uniref:Uncharacterized protein n=1 Tax=Dictyocaulus viviparus TaxID=29172 RepID=A0A0D8XI11_DICVI|nr:hypothetical protein DICVIV_10581 [Dictyocaulus viviparus]